MHKIILLVEELPNEKKVQNEKKIQLATEIYSQACNSIKATDEVSFKLLGLVLLVSAAGIFGISSRPEIASSPFLSYISFFAAIVTGALFIWEFRNLLLCRSYLRYAKLLEKYFFYESLGKPVEKVSPRKFISEEIRQMEKGEKMAERDKKRLRDCSGADQILMSI